MDTLSVLLVASISVVCLTIPVFAAYNINQLTSFYAPLDSDFFKLKRFIFIKTVASVLLSIAYPSMILFDLIFGRLCLRFSDMSFHYLFFVLLLLDLFTMRIYINLEKNKTMRVRKEDKDLSVVMNRRLV